MKLNLKALGNNIREYRLEAGMTQTDLSDLIGTKQQNVGAWETGQIEPRLSTLFLIAGAIGMNNAADLLRGVELIDEEGDLVAELERRGLVERSKKVNHND